MKTIIIALALLISSWVDAQTNSELFLKDLTKQISTTTENSNFSIVLQVLKNSAKLNSQIATKTKTKLKLQQPLTTPKDERLRA